MLARLRDHLIGELRPAAVQEDDPRLLWLVGGVAAAAAFLGLAFELRGAPLIRGAWRAAVHGGLPLAAIVLWHRRGRSVPAWLGAGLVVGPVLALVLGRGDLLRAHPGPAIAVLAAGAAVLVAAAPRGALAAWGIGAGDWRWWGPRTAAAVVLVVAGVGAALRAFPTLAAWYPWWKPARTDPQALALHQSGIVLDFLGWELLFRAFLLFGLARRGDVRLAIWTQALAFFLLHQGKPEVELLLSLPGGLLAGWFCWRARSFLPLWILHTVQMVALNVGTFWLRQAG